MSKEQLYKQALSQIKSVLESESNLIANLANVCAVIKEIFNHHWVGFYLVEGKQLVLGPFQGPLACTRIDWGKGVCGSAWRDEESYIVDDVHQFPGHIACSSLSNSEIVVPVFKNQIVCAVLDIDSTDFEAFDEIDQIYLEQIASLCSDFF